MSLKFSKPKAIILDIEGTTTDRKFVAKSLFPFIRNNLIRFFIETYSEPETQSVIASLRESQKSKSMGSPAIAESGRDAICKSVTEHLLWQMSRRMRSSELKQIEIMCWFWGYVNGLIKCTVYGDVSYALHEWKVKNNIKIGTFSSGLSIAQQLMFCRTNHGNIHCLIDQFFDNSIGDKTDPKSYESMAKTFGLECNQILFISDDDSEVKAAVRAGLKAALIKRPDGKRVEEVPNIPTITSFAEIKF